MSTANAATIERFYRAFDAGDGEAMASCYTDDVHFSDPVFPDLQGESAKSMWRMLTSAPGELGISLLDHHADEARGNAHWQASYVFTETGRPVLNDIHASFRFRDGLIAEHRDDFSFFAWARQALGPVGLLLGWTPILRGAVRRKAGGRLQEYLAAQHQGAAA